MIVLEPCVSQESLARGGSGPEACLADTCRMSLRRASPALLPTRQAEDCPPAEGAARLPSKSPRFASRPSNAGQFRASGSLAGLDPHVAGNPLPPKSEFDARAPWAVATPEWPDEQSAAAPPLLHTAVAREGKHTPSGRSMSTGALDDLCPEPRSAAKPPAAESSPRASAARSVSTASSAAVPASAPAGLGWNSQPGAPNVEAEAPASARRSSSGGSGGPSRNEAGPARRALVDIGHLTAPASRFDLKHRLSQAKFILARSLPSPPRTDLGTVGERPPTPHPAVGPTSSGGGNSAIPGSLRASFATTPPFSPPFSPPASPASTSPPTSPPSPSARFAEAVTRDAAGAREAREGSPVDAAAAAAPSLRHAVSADEGLLAGAVWSPPRRRLSEDGSVTQRLPLPPRSESFPSLRRSSCPVITVPHISVTSPPGTPTQGMSPRVTRVGRDLASSQSKRAAKAARVLPFLAGDKPRTASAADVAGSVAASIRALARRHSALKPRDLKYYTVSEDDRARLGLRDPAAQLLLLDHRNLFRLIGSYTVTSANIILLHRCLEDLRAASVAFDNCSAAFDDALRSARLALQQERPADLQQLDVLCGKEEAAFSSMAEKQAALIVALGEVIGERARPEFLAPQRTQAEDRESTNNAGGLAWLRNLVWEAARNTGDANMTWGGLASYVMCRGRQSDGGSGDSLCGSGPPSPAAVGVLDMFGGLQHFRANFTSWVRMFAGGRSPAALAELAAPARQVS